jgi:hypothetical protein
VFTHDGPDFSFNKDTAIEKLGHAFHMHEVNQSPVLKIKILFRNLQCPT